MLTALKQNVGGRRSIDDSEMETVVKRRPATQEAGWYQQCTVLVRAAM